MNVDNIKKYGKYIVSFVVIIILFATGYFINQGEEKNVQNHGENVETLYSATESSEDVNNNDNNNDNISNNEDINNIMKVEIKGAVISPGVYEIKEGDRVEDLVKKSGGFQKDADTIRIKLAQKLQDEEMVYVYKIGEEENIVLDKFKDENDSGTNKTGASQKKDNKININLATKEELMQLPGVGEVRAQAIIQYREDNGGFKSIEELKNVSGIGEKTLSKFSQLVDTK